MIALRDGGERHGPTCPSSVQTNRSRSARHLIRTRGAEQRVEPGADEPAERSTSRCQAASFARTCNVASRSSIGRRPIDGRADGDAPGEGDLLRRERRLAQDGGERGRRSPD